MATKKSSKKEQPKKEETEYSIKDTDKQIAIKYIDDFANGVKLGIQDTTDSEESKKEQIDFVDNFISDFKSTMTGDNLIIINKFLTEFMSGMAEFLVNKKNEGKNEEISFEFESIEGESESQYDLEKGERISSSKTNNFPYQILIKNLTDEKLYDVDLFNYDHEKQNKLAYSCGMGVEYNDFLRFLSALSEVKEHVTLLRFQVWCDYHKFRSKQFNCCLHKIITNINGNMQSVPLQVGNYFSPYQQQSDIIDIRITDDNRIDLFNQLQLRLSYLMPETEITITIYTSKIIE